MQMHIYSSVFYTHFICIIFIEEMKWCM